MCSARRLSPSPCARGSPVPPRPPPRSVAAGCGHGRSGSCTTGASGATHRPSTRPQPAAGQRRGRLLITPASIELALTSTVYACSSDPVLAAAALAARSSPELEQAREAQEEPAPDGLLPGLLFSEEGGGEGGAFWVALKSATRPEPSLLVPSCISWCIPAREKPHCGNDTCSELSEISFARSTFSVWERTCAKSMRFVRPWLHGREICHRVSSAHVRCYGRCQTRTRSAWRCGRAGRDTAAAAPGNRIIQRCVHTQQHSQTKRHQPAAGARDGRLIEAGWQLRHTSRVSRAAEVAGVGGRGGAAIHLSVCLSVRPGGAKPATAGAGPAPPAPARASGPRSSG